MLSKLNYFTRKKERSVYKNRFVRSLRLKRRFKLKNEIVIRF